MPKRIEAPKGKVIKAYLIDIDPFQRGLIRHAIIDDYGMVFIPTYGWSDLQGKDEYKIIPLPNPVNRGNEMNNRSWDHAGWWTFNWWCDSWAWCYSRKLPKFQACYTINMPGDMATIYSY